MAPRCQKPVVITCADENYFDFLPALEANIERRLGRLPVIYDLGLRDDQRSVLRSEILQVPVPEGFRDCDAVNGFILTTHKPACISDAITRHGSGCLYVDADMLFLSALDEAVLQDGDIAVTPRHRRERTPSHLKNGNINAGFLHFSNTAPALDLLTRWQAACEVGDRTDQKALSDLLEDFHLLDSFGPETRGGLRLLKLDPRIYNDVALKTGKVMHFKNAGRDPRIAAKLSRYRALETQHPRILSAWHALKRNVLLPLS